MNTILLQEYVSLRPYEFERSAGRVARSSVDSPVSGFFQRRKFGLVMRSEALVAVFLDGEGITLSIDGLEHSLTGGSVSAEIRGSSLGMVREFILKLNSTRVEHRKYWFISSEAWPDDGDILSLCCRIAADHDRGFVAVWRAMYEGRDLNSASVLRDLQ